MRPYSRASMASSAFGNRVSNLNGALGLSKSSVENFLKHPQAILGRRLISRVMSASLVTRPPRYPLYVLTVCLCVYCSTHEIICHSAKRPHDAIGTWLFYASYIQSISFIVAVIVVVIFGGVS